MTPKLSNKPDLRLKGFYDLSTWVLLLLLLSVVNNPAKKALPIN